MVGLLDKLTFDQQSEMIYVGYFNRAADEGGFSFWASQNAQAQAGGQSASVAIKNIANSFTPQTETLALYPFLGNKTFDPANTTSVVQVGAMVDGIYFNLFGRTPGANDGGRLYWVNQILTGAVGVGESVLDISNGATGKDAILLENKISIASDFTTRTGKANLGVNAAPEAFLNAARHVLDGADGEKSDDDSVKGGVAKTTAFIDDYFVLSLSTPATIDVSRQLPAFLDFDIAGTGDVAIINLTDAKHVSDLTGVVNNGVVSIATAPGNTVLGIDLKSSSTSGAAFNYASTTDASIHGIQIAGPTSINITSNGSVANTIAGFYAAPGSSVDGETVTVVGSDSLVLGSSTGQWSAFSGVGATGETMKASAFTGNLTYTSSGKGDTVVSGSGNDMIFAGSNDTITTGAGSDVVNVSLGNYQSPTASDITFITDLTAGLDKIQVGGGTAAARSFFDDTASTLTGPAATLALAGQQAFKDFVGAGAELAKSVVEFKSSGNLYDAISMNGSFASGGYYDSGHGAVSNMIVKITGATGTQSANDFKI
jgi:hypothetical protein